MDCTFADDCFEDQFVLTTSWLSTVSKVKIECSSKYSYRPWALFLVNSQKVSLMLFRLSVNFAGVKHQFFCVLKDESIHYRKRIMPFVLVLMIALKHILLLWVMK